MEQSGFILTTSAQQAFEAFETDGVRYAAEFDNGGFAAFGPMERHHVMGLHRYGNVYVEAEDDWDDLMRRLGRPRGPKRRLAIGDERFALLGHNGTSALALLHEVQEWSHTVGAVIVGDGFYPHVMLETTQDVEIPWTARWVGDAQSFADKRLLPV